MNKARVVLGISLIQGDATLGGIIQHFASLCLNLRKLAFGFVILAFRFDACLEFASNYIL